MNQQEAREQALEDARSAIIEPEVKSRKAKSLEFAIDELDEFMHEVELLKRKFEHSEVFNLFAGKQIEVIQGNEESFRNFLTKEYTKEEFEKLNLGIQSSVKKQQKLRINLINNIAKRYNL